VEHGLKGGVPGTWLVAAHGASIYPDLGHLYNSMCMMKSAQVGRFHRFQDDWTASGAVDGDGRADIITGAGAGGSPRVRVFSGAGGAVLSEFLAFDPGFTGGVHVAAGDLDRDGRADVITVAGPGGGPDARAFHISGNTGHLVASGVIPIRRNWKLPSPTERDRPLVAGRPLEEVER
jgi:hypothetical protein